jgi:3-hydroxyisobutyrate dehydrogenase-like beta-hydroxyacid dehydrogenase
MIIGLLHPGEMGASCAVALRSNGHEVIWAGADRGAATTRRAEDAGLIDVATVAAVRARADAIMSICPPHAALEVARQVVGFTGLYLDANALAPETVRKVAAVLGLGGATVVDGGIIGPPPTRSGTTRLYLSGPRAVDVAGWWTGTDLEVGVVGDTIGTASALKTTYAAWTKGSAALLLAVFDAAVAQGVEGPLLAELARSQPDVPARHARAVSAARAKGWRWVGEMEEVAALFADSGVPAGFLKAAAEVYRNHPRPGPA